MGKKSAHESFKELGYRMNDKDLKEDDDSDSGEMCLNGWCKIGDRVEIKDRSLRVCQN